MALVCKNNNSHLTSSIKKQIASVDYDFVYWAMIGLQKSDERLVKDCLSVEAVIYIYTSCPLIDYA